MRCLLIRLEGPLQSWGYRSRFSDRDTGLEPTKSGIVGLLCCSLGRSRQESPADLAALRLHVRVDREGALLSDFHTAGAGVFRGSRKYFAPVSGGGKAKDNAILTERHYLQDASFLAALEGEAVLLEKLDRALQDPAWPLALGRRSCPPSQPVHVGLREAAPLDALRAEPLRLPKQYVRREWDDEAGMYADSPPRRFRFVEECAPDHSDAQERRDVPLDWSDTINRRYGVRTVRIFTEELTPEVIG